MDKRREGGGIISKTKKCYICGGTGKVPKQFYDPCLGVKRKKIKDLVECRKCNGSGIIGVK